MLRLYLHLLARHGVFVDRPYGKAIPFVGEDGDRQLDWSAFDLLTGALLDGTLFPDCGPATSFRTPVPPNGLDEDEIRAFYREAAQHARERGWLGRMYYYLPDEPLRKEYPEVIAVSRFVKSADGDIRTLVTEPYTPELEGFIDIWCPDLPTIGDSFPVWPYMWKGYAPGKKGSWEWQWHPWPTVYQPDDAKAHSAAWFYPCVTASFLDYPNLFIDSSVQHHRMLAWLAFGWDFAGILNWHTTAHYLAVDDVWEESYSYYANGDGNLLYPGTPGRSGLLAHGPVPSLRLKAFREGLEDHAYLTLLADRYGREEALRFCRKILRGSLGWTHDADRLMRIRQEIQSRLNG